MPSASLSSQRASLRWLSNEYFEQNGDNIEILENPPSSLEFSRLVHISRPVVIKGLKVPASTLWSDEYLIDRMGARQISIAVTPNGLADAVTVGPDDQFFFVEPLLDKMTMAEFLSNISTNLMSNNEDICYLQSQNGNLYSGDDFAGQGIQSFSEFEPLRSDVPSEIAFCTEALGRSPDAVNLWIGDGRSVTSIHSDPYENIYTVLRGAKHFTLLPPTEGWCLNECRFPHASYQRCSKTGKLFVQPSEGVDNIRWSSVSSPHITGALPQEAHPIHITLGPGDTLYLPAGWWHHVRQLPGATTIALNWWYDMEMRGMSWVMLSFLRGINEVPFGNTDEDDEEVE
ncbi:JmjC domain-containing protein E [Termitomyces sp. J132]|nr:JmjC domain-containing protein E [Termitomyces sp. J132]